VARPTGTLEWKLSSLAHSMHLTEEDVQLYFTDGRRVYPYLLERRIAYELLDGTLAPSEGAGWDVRDAQGRNGRFVVSLKGVSISVQAIWSDRVGASMRLGS